MSFTPVADLFRQLSDPTRVRIFWLLCHGEYAGIGLSGELGVSGPAVSHHLRALKDAGLIVGRREGREVFYRTADTATAGLLHRTIEEAMDMVCPHEERCSAVDEDALPPENDGQELIRRVHDYLTDHLDRRVPMAELSRRFGVNATTLNEGFRRMYGRSPAAHMKAHRMERGAALLRQGHPVGEVAAAVGYDSPSKFTAAFRDHYGVTPREYRK